MRYQAITADHANFAKDAKAVCKKLNASARKALLMLEAEFSSDSGVGLGVTLVPSADGLQASITSPFGEARSIFSSYLHEHGIFGRCLFARKEQDLRDHNVWRPVFHFDISSDDQILYEMAEVNRFDLNTPYRHQYFSLALAITAGLGRELDPLGSS